MDAIDARAVWSTAYQNNLPDSSFLYIEDGGKKDGEGKTVPRTLRHFPYKDADGKVDLPHLRNALARIPQSKLPADVKKKLTAKAEKILAAQGDSDSDDSGGSDNDNDSGRTADATLELRYAVAPITHVDVRDPSSNDDGTWTMSGYAAVFNRSTTLYDGRFLKRTEDIDPGFFDDVLRNQNMSQPDGVVHFNFGHDMNRAVAATDVPVGQPGSLSLRSDAHGLFYLAKVARDDPDGVALASKMRTGVIKQASFAFTIAEKDTSTVELGEGRVQEHDRLMRAGRLYDVCATPQGAYPQTVSQLRSYAAALGQPSERENVFVSYPFTSTASGTSGTNNIVLSSTGGQPRQPGLGGETPVSPETGGRGARRRLTAEQRRGIARHAKR